MTRTRRPRVFLCALAALLTVAGCGDSGGGGGNNDGGPPPDGTAVDGSPEADGAVVTPELNCDSVTCGSSTGSTIPVNSGEDLQAALDSANPGDTLVLEAGATFTGNFVLPNKTGSECIIVRTSTQDDSLPEGVRVTPTDAAKMARVVTPGNGLPAVRTEPRAHNYHLIGLEIMPESAGSEVYDLVALGGGSSVQTTLDEVPREITIDRCYIHGWPDANFKRGIGLNSAHTCVISSHISDFHSDFQDSQAIGGVNGPGPFRIINNRLEGGAENIMFGGGVPSINGLVPEDIVIRGNHFFKPLVWKADDPGNTGYTPWVKNLFEIKNGRNVTLEGNLLENNWVGADQHGFAVVLTPRSEGGAVPWAVVERVRITSNIFRHVGGGVAILGRDTGGSSQQTNQIHNYGLSAGSTYAGAGTDGTDPGFDPAAVDVARGIAAP